MVCIKIQDNKTMCGRCGFEITLQPIERSFVSLLLCSLYKSVDIFKLYVNIDIMVCLV